MTDLSAPLRLTSEELNQLAVEIVTNVVYCVNSDDAVRCSFGMILALMEITPEVAEKIGAIYAPMAEAGDRSVNGYPVFFSARFLHIDDFDPLVALINQKRAALDLVGTE